ncbi:MAG: putative methyltransferase YodH [Acidobacteria bacterium]|nr:putative methyltransferase YodH [Acidobacteriota bacterium]
MEYVLTATKTEARAGSYYDKIWRLYDLTFKLNGYGRSLDQYFASHPPPVSRGSSILDAGCGTGLLTLALLRAVNFPVSITSLDLSASSVTATRKAVAQSEGRRSDVNFMQGNVLSLPFADNSFDFVVTSGALEYMPLEDGLNELARVITPRGHLLHLPVRPSLTSTMLEIGFRFKHHSPRDVMQKTAHHFKVVDHFKFPPLQAIGWSKTALLAQKI